MSQIKTIKRDGRVNVLLGVSLLVGTLLLFYGSLLFMRDSAAHKLLIALVALVVGVGGVWALFYSFNRITLALPTRVSRAVQPYAFTGPAVALLFIFLFYPIGRTFYISLFDRTAENFVGLDHYLYIFTDPDMGVVLRNSLLWITLVPAFAVTLGLLVAVMTDHLSAFWERMVKSFIFIPMAISFIGASVIWRFVYYYQPPGYDQIGLLNAIVTSLGGAPQAWLTQIPWNAIGVPWINNLFLIFIMIWLQTGFAMMVLSTAVKGVPRQLLEAAQVDGANEIGIFFKITLPYIRGAIITVTTTILIIVLKIFDIVFVMTSGQFDTDVVASKMFIEAFKFRNYGRGSALSVLLFLAVIPFIVHNVMRWHRERG